VADAARDVSSGAAARAVLRHPTLDDVLPAAVMHHAAWQEAYPGIVPPEALAARDLPSFERSWARIAGEHAVETVIAVLDHEVVGFAGTRPCRDDPPPRQLELWGLYVRASQYGTGLASRLIEEALQHRPASLWVFEQNPRARAFYRKHGFLEDGASQTHEIFGGAAEVRMVR